MIRFTCPGCETPFSVGDEKAGKAGKCPKCHSQFTIPAEPNAPNDPPPAPPPIPESPPAPPSGSTPVEISPCPGCGSRLSVEASDLGLDIECPNCQTQYKALRAGEAPPPPKKSSDAFQRPSRRNAAEDEEDEVRPSQRSRRKRDEEEDEVRPSRRSMRRDDDDDDEYRRSSKSKVKPGGVTAVAVMLLVGGILACVYMVAALGYIGLIGLGTMGMGLVCCLWPGYYYELVFGIMAIVRASQMLGKHDPKGPPKGLCIMQIICIVNVDWVNCVLGIIGLVMLGQEDVRRWYARRGFRS
jgi:predicted Zn finger-like uncharacterized protein